MDNIGVAEIISIGKYTDVPAKIDTGADASAIWASKIRVDKDGILKFSLFGVGSPHYTGRVLKRTVFGVAKVKSSNGTMEMRYRTHLTVKIGGRKIRALFYLADRSTQKFPVIIGRRTVAGKFMVDVSQKAVKLQRPKKTGLNDMLKADPHQFHKRYVKKAK